MRVARASVRPFVVRAASTSTRAASQWSRLGGGAVVLATAGVGLAVLSPDTAHAAGGKVNWDAVRKDVVAIIDAEDRRREDGTGIGPTFVRLAWHASGTYDKASGTGGSNGATMRFPPEANWGANQGLVFARRLLEPIKAKYPGLTYADLWTFAGKVAIEEAGGPVIPWKPGRSDAVDGTKIVPDGRLPDASQGPSHVRDVFSRMGFTDQETVALIGAHALGRGHIDNSGYVGPWTRAETTFSNNYFTLLLEEKWTPKKTHKGNKWTGPLQYEDKTGDLFMAPADLALVQDPEYKKWVDAYAKDEQLFFKHFALAFGKLMALGVPGQDPFGAPSGAGGIIDTVKGFLGLK